jgi:hypothetical protein
MKNKNLIDIFPTYFSKPSLTPGGQVSCGPGERAPGDNLQIGPDQSKDVYQKPASAARFSQSEEVLQEHCRSGRPHEDNLARDLCQSGRIISIKYSSFS